MRTSAEGSGGHHGLNIMRDRAEEVGAALDIDSRSENGTRVMVSWA
jgi:nitrate/nitrite-specific signal transduction histidine kinase